MRRQNSHYCLCNVALVSTGGLGIDPRIKTDRFLWQLAVLPPLLAASTAMSTTTVGSIRIETAVAPALRFPL